MAYSDPKFQIAYERIVLQATSFGTATAASAVGCDLDLSAVAILPKFIRRVEVKAIRVRCTVIPDAGSTAVKLHFLNGTSTFGVVTLTTATAGQWIDGTVTASNAIIAANDQPTCKTTGTATASADAMGTYEITFELAPANY